MRTADVNFYAYALVTSKTIITIHAVDVSY